MKWNNPTSGSSRVVKKFAWWPIRIGKEARWLERVTIRQQYVFNGYSWDTPIYVWFNVEFLD